MSATLVPSAWRVVAVRDEIPATVTLDLVPVEGAPPPFRPAQVDMLALPGVGEVPISISSDPLHDGGVRSHTIRACGAVTDALCALVPGDVVGVRGPFGTSWECESAEGGDVVVVAGGIGLAPLRSAICTVAGRRDRYGRVRVLLGARTPADVLYAGDVDDWRAAGLEVAVTVERSGPGWDGPVGLVTALVEAVDLDPGRSTAWVCGPDRMMQAVTGVLVRRGLAPARIRLTLERNMKCAVGLCGHCQLGPVFVCRDGPVVAYDRLAPFYAVPEV